MKILLEQFLRGLKNVSIQNRLITQVDDLSFEKVVVLHNAEIEIYD